MRHCQVSGCTQPPSSSFSRYCNHHRSRLRRNGDPGQRGITKADLKPFVEMVNRRIAQNLTNPTWEKMDARWDALVRHAEGRVAAYQAGTASPRQTIQAAEEIVRLAATVESRQVVVAAAAMSLMHTLQPERFRSDRAFDTQLVRRVRGLTAANSTPHRDAKTAKARRVYRELSPRAAAVLSDWLQETLGVLGIRLAKLEEDERRAERQDSADLSDAMMALR